MGWSRPIAGSGCNLVTDLGVGLFLTNRVTGIRMTSVGFN